MPEKVQNIKIAFFGTPDFAVPTLRALINAPFCHVGLVVTQPDKPIGRHHSKPIPSPIKTVALENNIPVIDSLDALSGSFDIAVLVAFGTIIPQHILDLFPKGIINIHPSLLPKYRGSSPIQTALLNRDKETGVTIMLLDSAMDHGPILARESAQLSQTETAGELHNLLAEKGAELLMRTLPQYLSGTITPTPQDETQATYTQKLSKETGKIDWSKTAQEIDAHVRAMNPWPGAWTEVDGKRILVWKTNIAPDNTLSIAEVQPSGKKAMSYEDYCKGNKPIVLT